MKLDPKRVHLRCYRLPSVGGGVTSDFAEDRYRTYFASYCDAADLR
jgi:hypothetical protein